MSKKVLMIGAHLDDCDYEGGGTALRYREAGYEVRFLSLCNGNGGHHKLSSEEIVERRRLESEAIMELTGVTYDVWSDMNDCELMATQENRQRLVRYIREYNPDIIFSHRTNDYHADHRNAALLVQDASYLLIVPNYCADVPAMRTMPVIVYFHDNFTEPLFKPAVIVPTDSVIEKKYDMYECYVSQVYEWLPYTDGVEEQVPSDPAARREWLRSPRVPRDGALLTVADLDIPKPSSASEYHEAACAVKFRDLLVRQYGEEARSTLFAEAFQLSEYGAPLTKDNVKDLFPWVKNF